jgi:uncharacterized membrane protein YqhA
MSRFLTGTRFLILVPIIGLTIAAAFFFVLGGISLTRLATEYFLALLGVSHSSELDHGLVIVEVVEHVHTFLVGTVLYLTAVGLYQLFIGTIPFPAWLKVESPDELETNLIGVTVVVLAVNFMGESFATEADHILQYGAGIALPIAALGLFIALRAWAAKNTESAHTSTGDRVSETHQQATAQTGSSVHKNPPQEE